MKRRGFVVVATLILSTSLFYPVEVGAADVFYDIDGSIIQNQIAGGQGETAFPILLMPVGGEYEGMAGAYTAVARDISFFEANPAASSRLDVTELAVWHNNVIADAALEGLFYTERFEHLGVAAGMKVLHVNFTPYDLSGIQENAAIRYTESVLGLNLSYNFFHSFDFHGLALGANLKAAYRNVAERIAPAQSSFVVMGDVGLLTRVDFLKFYSSRDRNFSAGLVLRNVGTPANLGTESLADDTTTITDPLPTEATLGIAYSPIRPLILAFDLTRPVSLFGDVGDTSLEFAWGTSVTITDFLTAHGGFALEGGNPRLTLGASVSINDIDLFINQTADITTQVGEADRFSLQASFDFGDKGRAERRATVEEFYLDALVAFADGNLERAMELSRRALELDPTFSPAEETLQTASRMQNLQSRMEDIRRGEQELVPETPEEPETPDDLDAPGDSLPQEDDAGATGEGADGENGADPANGDAESAEGTEGTTTEGAAGTDGSTNENTRADAEGAEGEGE